MSETITSSNIGACGDDRSIIAATEQDYKQFIQNLPVYFYAVESEKPHRPIYISPSFTAFGYTLEDWHNDPKIWTRVIHPDDRDETLNRTRDAMNAGGDVDLEYRIIAADGAVSWVRDRGCFIRDPSGEPRFWQGILIDISEQKALEEELRDREKLARTIVKSIPRSSVLLFDRELRYTLADGELLKERGLSTDLFEGHTLYEALPQAIADQWSPYYLKALDGIASSVEHSQDGMTWSIEFAPVRNENDEVFAGVVYWSDITHKREDERAMRDAVSLLESTFESTGDGIVVLSSDRQIVRCNKKFVELWHPPSELIESCDGDQLYAFLADQLIDPAPFTVRLDDLYLDPDASLTETVRLKDGRVFERSTQPRYLEGVPIGRLCCFRDVTVRNQAEAYLRHYALHDPLTNLPNRVSFMDYLSKAVERAKTNKHAQFAVLFLDLDRFKVINDSLGHAIGDKLLIAAGKRLAESIRPGDIVARLGGDEFTILLHRSGSANDVSKVAERLQARLSAPFRIDNYEVFTTASIGIISSGENIRTPEEYLRDADTAMYRAKESGKDRFEIFDREMHVRNLNLLQIENDLRRAVERQEFQVLYQPIVDLTTGTISEFEALIRWNHPEHGLVQPNEFIKVAEETGSIVPIGKWVLEEASKCVADWRARFGIAVSVSVNLSARQLMHPDLADVVMNCIRSNGLDRGQIKLEVTESTVMEHRDHSLRILEELHANGIELSTDDFGTGYSSLSYLQQYPFRRLKIDRSFVCRIEEDEKSRAIIRTIAMLGTNLGIGVVAEGIETRGQLNFIQELGCRHGQGYLFSPPVNSETAEKFLKARADGFELPDSTRVANVVTR